MNESCPLWVSWLTLGLFAEGFVLCLLGLWLSRPRGAVAQGEGRAAR